MRLKLKRADKQFAQEWLVFEYFQGDLQHFVFKKSLTIHELYDIVSGVACGLNLLHSIRVAHLDLKPENVFYKMKDDTKIIPMIGDLTTTRRFTTNPAQLTCLAGTPEFYAPEISSVSATNPIDPFAVDSTSSYFFFIFLKFIVLG